MEMYHWYKIDWHVKFEKSMQVIGLCERSGHAYSHTMRLLIEYFPPPDLIAEEELLDYFIHRQDVSGWSPATMLICHVGIKLSSCPSAEGN